MTTNVWDTNIYIPSVRSGQTAVTTAGTEVALGSGEIHGPLAIKALAANTGLVFVGRIANGTVASSTGFQLAAGEVITLNYVSDLGDLLVDSAVNGEGVCWIALNV